MTSLQLVWYHHTYHTTTLSPAYYVMCQKHSDKDNNPYHITRQFGKETK